jgi:hypothetical protein
VIRTRSNNDLATPLSNRATYIIPIVLPYEAGTATTANSDSMLKKAACFIITNRNRTFAAMPPPDLHDLECVSGSVAPRHAIVWKPWINPGMPKQLYAEDLAESMKKTIVTSDLWPKLEIAFNTAIGENAIRIRDQLVTKYSARIFDDLTLRSQICHNPMHIWSIIETSAPTANMQSHQLSEYQVHAKYALSRWYQILLWYTLDGIAGPAPTANRNNWADSYYLFLASYCDELWTTDSRMIIVCKSLYPHVKCTLIETNRQANGTDSP